MTHLPLAVPVRVLASGLRGRVWLKHYRQGERTPYAYVVKLNDGSEVECGRDELEVLW